MFRRHPRRRTLRIGACAALTFLYAAAGAGEPERSKGDKAACKAAHKAAKEREMVSKLREAKDLYLSCAKPACSAPMRSECSAKFTQLQFDVPSVIPIVTDDTGASQVDVQVTIDGEIVATKLDGRAFPVDPGLHEFTFTTKSGVVSTQRQMIVVGQRNTPIGVSLGQRGQRTLAAAVTVPTITNKQALEPKPAEVNSPPDKAPPAKLSSAKALPSDAATETTGPDVHRNGPGLLPYVVGGAGLLAVGAGALFTVWGNKDNDAFGQCSPDCAPSSVKHVKTLYIAADISFGAGAVALAASAFLFATSSSPAHERPPVKAAYAVDVVPTRGGAFATVSGAF